VKKRVLFVDDEPLALQGLQRMLRTMRGEWEMFFAASGAEGLELMSQAPFDVVVSDMLMPGMNGAQFLGEVRRLFPKTVRIVLSGHAQKDLVLQAVGPVHQYLAKPCPPEILKAVVLKASSLGTLLENDGLRKFVAQLDRIPSIPSLYRDITEKLQGSSASAEEIAELVMQDPGMTAKILKVVNSAFFGFYGSVSSVGKAVSCLGLETIKSLVLSVDAFTPCEPGQFEHEMDVLWKHSLDTAFGASMIASSENAEKEVTDAAFAAGLLHDVGKFVLVWFFGPQYTQAVRKAQEENIEIRDAEKQIFEASHDKVGAYLAGLWALPERIVEAISWHHCPEMSASKGFTALTAVHVANALAYEQNDAINRVPVGRINMSYLTELGLAERLEAWRDAMGQRLCVTSRI
jgi:HD-like signal output (HDOD) protein/ActR/RegA family two-component response regulator